MSAGSTIIVAINGASPDAVQTVVFALRGELDISRPSEAFFTTEFQALMAGFAMVTGGTAEISGLEPGTYTLMGMTTDQTDMANTDDPFENMQVTSTLITIQSEGQELNAQLSF
jgi:hypothetical protein